MNERGHGGYVCCADSGYFGDIHMTYEAGLRAAAEICRDVFRGYALNGTGSNAVAKCIDAILNHLDAIPPAEGRGLAAYPNLQAMMDGRVSGHFTEWPQMRVELRNLLAALRREQAAPVAWRYRSLNAPNDPWCVSESEPPAHIYDSEPLYAAPSAGKNEPAPEGENYASTLVKVYDPILGASLMRPKHLVPDAPTPAREQGEAVAHDWVTVPRTPTQEMVEAACALDDGNDDTLAVVINMYVAMLEAAPKERT